MALYQTTALGDCQDNERGDVTVLLLLADEAATGTKKGFLPLCECSRDPQASLIPHFLPGNYTGNTDARAVSSAPHSACL